MCMRAHTHRASARTHTVCMHACIRTHAHANTQFFRGPMLYEEITGTWAEQVHRLKNKSGIDRFIYERTTSQAMEGQLVEKKLAKRLNGQLF